MLRTMPEQLRFVKCIIAFFVLTGYLILSATYWASPSISLGLVDCRGTSRGQSTHLGHSLFDIRDLSP